MKLEQTSLQKIEFGDELSDQFYCLVDLRISPGGINIEKMKLTDPRNIDHAFRDAGCILMLTGEDVTELVNRGNLDPDDLHNSLYRLAIQEGSIPQKE